MKKPSESAFIPNVSVGQAPLAIIKWPEGLSGSPAIFPMGDTFEESGAIREFLEGVLRNQD